MVVRIAIRFKDDVSIVGLSGKFVAGSDGPFLRQKVKELIDAGARKLLFDFSEVPYIDSTGLGFLAGSREMAADNGAAIVLAGINQHVQRILDGVKLTQFFEFAPDENAALTRLEQLSQGDKSKGSKASRPKSRPATTAED